MTNVTVHHKGRRGAGGSDKMASFVVLLFITTVPIITKLFRRAARDMCYTCGARVRAILPLSVLIVTNHAESQTTLRFRRSFRNPLA